MVILRYCDGEICKRWGGAGKKSPELKNGGFLTPLKKKGDRLQTKEKRSRRVGMRGKEKSDWGGLAPGQSRHGEAAAACTKEVRQKIPNGGRRSKGKMRTL